MATSFQRVTLIYCDIRNLTSVSGAGARWLYRANSVFDPDYTGTGDQPSGFDQYAALYRHYAVIGSKCTVIATADSDFKAASFQTDPVVSLRLDEFTTVPGSLEDELMQPGCKFRVCARGSSADRDTALVQKYDAAKYWGVKSIMDRSNSQAQVSANPNDSMYYHVAMNSHNQTSSTDVGVLIRIMYDTIFFDAQKRPAA